MEYKAYLGTNSTRGSRGIYALGISDDGGIRELGTAKAQDSGYVCLSPDGKLLFAAVESMVTDGEARACVSSYAVGKNGVPEFICRRPVTGQLTCHVSTDSKRLYASSYLHGTVTVFDILPDGALSPKPVAVIRHEATYGEDPHIHASTPTPDGKYLCVVEVGYHAVMLYDTADFKKAFEIRTAALRPRQVEFSENFMYLIMEAGKTVEVYAYAPNEAVKLRHVQSVSIIPEDFTLPCGSGGLKLSPDGSLLFAACRGADMIAVYRVDRSSGRLAVSDFVRMPAVFPRDFNITPDGRLIVVGLQKSDEIAVYRVNYEKATLELISSGYPVPSCSGVALM